ncbi:hypothetical protein [Thermofilum pendens]|uniref:4Fe-4S ferredoxin-type domain-containing protein n=1 Tax=Thermofilum pendens (strain DSM 2475 / Hrk 5) TaxID=368408 RepID=A1RZY8_THEPD|nr:hypothetical protein [Thermofilum pendens]ABL78768.1 hypothetical protein Tpen_1371 [Thermofilum pendens Hrk 5]
MVSLKALRAVKVTPGLAARLALLPFRRVKNPCIYCPGICLASCPTYTATGNVLLSPLGYSRFKEVAAKNCLKCWRCSFECPLGFQLPETYSPEPAKPRLHSLKPGETVLVADLELDAPYAEKLAEALGTGLALVSGVAARYSEGRPLDAGATKKLVKRLGGAEALVAASPEVSHALGVDFFALHLAELGVKISYEGPVHVPCLLKPVEEKLLKALEEAGVKATEVDDESCIKQGVKKGYLYLCPRAAALGATTIYDLASTQELRGAAKVK